MNEMMIDIETLSTDPQAVVLSVAAHTFYGNVAGDFGSAKMWTLNLQQQLDKKRSVSESTLMFWTNLHNTPAFDIAFKQCDRLDVALALSELSNFLFVTKADIFWANSPNFDMIILESLYRDFQIKVPWRYGPWRDVRTIAAEAGLNRKWTPSDWDDAHEMPHHPLSDCRWQIAMVKEARRRLGIAANAS